MKPQKNTLLFLRLALFFSILGSGITWTGLGYELAITYNEPGLMGIMQIISTSAGLLGPLTIAFFAFKLTKKVVIIFSDIISAACYLVLYLLLHNSSIDVYGLFIVSVLIFSSIFLGAIQAIYFEPLYASFIAVNKNSKEGLTREFAQLGSYITFSKLLGMGLGPIIFGMLHYYALFINSFSFLISTYLFYYALKNISKDDCAEMDDNSEKNKQNSFILKYNQICDNTFLEGAIASSLIFIVVLFLSIKLIALQPTPVEMSIYWISATLCALISQMAISKSLKLHNFLDRLDNNMGFLFCLPILASLFVSNIWSLILCQMIFSFLNPISRNLARARFYQRYGNQDRATSVYAMRDFVTQVLILVFGLTTSFYYSNFVSELGALFITVLIVLRWYFSKSEIAYASER